MGQVGGTVGFVAGVDVPVEVIEVRVDGVVVGVDGSAGSEEALDWSLREARGRSCGLELFTAWYPSRDIRQIERLWAMTSTDELEDQVRRDLAPALAAAVSRTGTERVPVTRQVRYGHPAKALIDAAGP